MSLQNASPPGQIRISIRARSTLVFTTVNLILFIVLFILLNQFGESLVRDNAPNILGSTATPELIQRILDTLHTQLSVALIVMFTVSYVAAIVLVLMLGHSMSRPLVVLTRYAEQVEAGDYTPMPLPSPGRFRDEVTILTEAFLTMVEKVQGREQKLKQQVVELQIAIDTHRKAQQVEEITESEFFSNLKARAHEMRQTGAKSQSEATDAKPAADQSAPLI